MTRRSLSKSTPSQSSSDPVHVPRTFIDDWSIKEKLLLASLAIEHKESWLAVRSSMRSFMESDRPTDILHNQCAAQYEKLKEEEPELAQSLRGRSKRHSQTADPTIYRLEIYRKLAERRIDEIKKSLPDKREKMISIKSDLDLIKSGQATQEDKARIEQRVEKMKKGAEEARLKHAALLEKKKEEYENSKRLRTSRTKTFSETGSTQGEISTTESETTNKVATDNPSADKQDTTDKLRPTSTSVENNKSIDSENQDNAFANDSRPKSKTADSTDKQDKKKEIQDKDRPETRARQTEESDRETRKTRENTRTSRGNIDRKPTTTDSNKDEAKDDNKTTPKPGADLKKEVKEPAGIYKNESAAKPTDATPTRATTRRESSRQQSESNKQKVKRVMAMIFRDTKQHENMKLLDRPAGQPDTENYNSVIYKPIDLAQIKKKMDTDLDNPIELQNDLLIMFQNACMFYPESHPTHQAAIKMRSDLSPKWELAMNEFVPPQAQGKEATPSQSKVRPRERRQGSLKGNASLTKSSAD